MPIHLLPPWCRPFCSLSRSRSVSMSLSKPPSASICLLLLLGEMLLGELPQPLGRDLRGRRVGQKLEPLEDVAEHAVELVEIALVLHQRGAGEIVELLDPPRREVALHRLHQGEIFAQRHRDAGGFELMEEGDEHSGASAARPPAQRRRGTFPKYIGHKAAENGKGAIHESTAARISSRGGARGPFRGLGLFAAAVQPAHAQAQDYPNRPVHILVGFAPGSVADLTARVLANRLGQVLGQQFVVENKTGAGIRGRGGGRRPRAEGRLHAVSRLVGHAHQPARSRRTRPST